jgi:hypothetical protein
LVLVMLPLVLYRRVGQCSNVLPWFLSPCYVRIDSEFVRITACQYDLNHIGGLSKSWYHCDFVIFTRFQTCTFFHFELNLMAQDSWYLFCYWF